MNAPIFELITEEKPPFVEQYLTLDGELTAVLNGQKSMSMFDWIKADVDDDSAQYEEVVSTALELGLSVIHRPYKSAAADENGILKLKTFVLHDHQAWRVPAFMMLLGRLVSDNWSDELECLASELLGYTEEQCESWISYHRHRHLGWSGMTLCMLLTEEQHRCIEDTGYTSIPSEAYSTPIRVFLPRGFNVVSRDADKLVKRHQLRLARVAVRHSFGAEILGPGGKDPVSMTHIDETVRRDFSRNLCSKIQVFDRGWK